MSNIYGERPPSNTIQISSHISYRSPRVFLSHFFYIVNTNYSTESVYMCYDILDYIYSPLRHEHNSIQIFSHIRHILIAEPRGQPFALRLG